MLFSDHVTEISETHIKVDSTAATLHSLCKHL